MKQLKGKIVLVTGGASGIGKIMVRLLLERAAKVIIWDINELKIAETISEFSNTMQIVATLCIDDFTEKNGATVVYPFSHTSNRNPNNIKNKKYER